MAKSNILATVESVREEFFAEIHKIKKRTRGYDERAIFRVAKRRKYGISYDGLHDLGPKAGAVRILSPVSFLFQISARIDKTAARTVKITI